MRKYPFKFLDSYTREDKDIYFGREEESGLLYEMVFQTNILLVFGPVGTGKTSLIQCGLAQKFETHDWLSLSVRRGMDLNDSLRVMLHKAIKESSGTEFIGGADIVPTLAQLFKALYLNTFKPVYLIFDQFEELYILGDKEDEEPKFIKSVIEILKVEYPVKMIFSIREEYLGYLVDFEKEVPELFRKKLRVEPMGLPKVKNVIMSATKTEQSNVKLKEGEEVAICEAIFHKIKMRDKTLTIQLPYLQVLLNKLYNEITHDEEHYAPVTIRLETVQDIGNLGDVLRGFLEDQVRRISQDECGLEEKEVWEILSPLTTLEGTKEPMSLDCIYERLPNIPKHLVRETILSFVDKKILRHLEEQNLYEVVHDCIAQKIAENRSEDEIILLEACRLIKSHASIHAKIRENFTENQLSFIEPFIGQLGERGLLKDADYQLIEESKFRIALVKKLEGDKQRKEIATANEIAERERELRSYAEIARTEAIEARNKTRLFLRTTLIALFVMIILCLVAGFFYFKAEQARHRTIHERHLNAANKLKASGDEYMRIGKIEDACDSYKKGLDTLKGLTDEPLYGELKKLQSLCK